MSPPDGTTTTATGTEGTSTGTTSTGTTTTGTTDTTGAGAGTTDTGTGAGTTGTGTGAAATGTTGTTATEPPKGPWADDWRKTMGRGDDAAIKRLERYKDPEAVFDALVNAQKKIDSGVIKSRLPDNATPEQVAEYRKENGIPETADKYDLTLSNGLVVGEADKPLIDGFLKHAHGKNWTPDRVKEGLEWYYSQQDALRQERETADATFKQESTAELGKRYGADFRRNIAHVDRFLEEFPEGIKDKVLGARLPNGRLAGSDPDFIDFLYQQALFRNPIATVMGGNSEAQVKAAETRLNELIKMSGDSNSDYNKGPNREKLRQEHLDLIDSLEKVKAAKR